MPSTADTGHTILTGVGHQPDDEHLPFGTTAIPGGLVQQDPVSGGIPAALMPSVSITSVTTVANQAARLALTAQAGDVAIQTDTGVTYILAQTPASVNGNWKVIEGQYPVTTVFGRSGAVAATSGDYTASQITFTPAGSIASTTVQAAIEEVAAEAGGGATTDASDLTSGTLADARLSSNVAVYSPAQVAVGTITMSGIATADQTFTIGTQGFTWKATRTGAGEVEIGTTALEAAQNIATAITEDFFGALIPVAGDSGGGIATVIVTAFAGGQAFNTYVFSPGNSSNMAMDGSGYFGGTTIGVDAIGPVGTSLTTVSGGQITVNNSSTMVDAALRICVPAGTAWKVHLVTSFSGVLTAGLKVSFGDADGLIAQGNAAYFNTETPASPLAYQSSNVNSFSDGGALAAATSIAGGFLVLDAYLYNLAAGYAQFSLTFAQETPQLQDTTCFGGTIIATRLS